MQYIYERGDLRRFYTQIPNLADDELDPYEMRLYIHYKRVAGEGGECYEGIDTTAKKCKMSVSSVRRTRKVLAQKGWIELESKGKAGMKLVHVTLVDKWEDNYTHYTYQKTSTPISQTPPPYLTDTRTPISQTPKEELYKEKPIKKNGGGNSSIATDNPSPVPSSTAAAVSKDLTAIIKALRDINETLTNPFTGVEDLARTLLQNGKTPDDVTHLWNAMQFKNNPAGAFIDAIKRNYTPKTMPAPKPKYTPQEGEERMVNGVKKIFKRGKWYDAHRVAGGNE